MRRLLALGLLVLTSACGKSDPPPASPASTSAAVPESPAPSASAEPEVSAAAKRPLEVFNGCMDVATVVFGADPKAATASKRTIAAGATISDAPRTNDGTQTVFLLDASGASIVEVHVKKQMKRVEVGRSCRTLDAR